MKIVCTRNNLSKGLNAISRIVGKNTSLPILGYVLLETDGGRLKLSVTNLELGAVCWVGCHVEKEGKIAVPAHLFQGVISSLLSDKVELDGTGEVFIVSDQSSRSEICILGAEDFPLIPRISGDSLATFASTQLHEALSRVVNACAQSESRPEISGVYVCRREKEVVFAATDSYRLAEASFHSSGDHFSFILPFNAAAEVVRLSSEMAGDAEVFLSENQVFFKFHSFYIVSRLIDGQYPDYMQIVPKGASTKATVRKDDVVRAVKSVALFADRKTNDIRFVCKEKGPICEISAVSSESGKGNTKIVPIAYEGNDQEIVINYRYFLDGLANIRTENVVLELSSGTEPFVLRPEDIKNYFYILMPINA